MFVVEIGTAMRIRYMITLKPPYTMFWSDGHAMIKTDSVHRGILDLPAFCRPRLCVSPPPSPASSQGSKVSDYIWPSPCHLVTDGALEIGNIMFQSSGDNQLLTPENAKPIFPNLKVFWSSIVCKSFIGLPCVSVLSILSVLCVSIWHLNLAKCCWTVAIWALFSWICPDGSSSQTLQCGAPQL